MKRLSRLIRDQKAATAVEYGLILALIFLAMAVGVATLGSTNAGLWGNVANAVKGG